MTEVEEGDRGRGRTEGLLLGMHSGSALSGPHQRDSLWQQMGPNVETHIQTRCERQAELGASIKSLLSELRKSCGRVGGRIEKPTGDRDSTRKPAESTNLDP